MSYYCIIRTRNSPLGRLKPIKTKFDLEGLGIWGIDQAYSEVIDTISNYLSKYHLPFLNSSIVNYAKCHKQITSVYLQVNAVEDPGLPSNAFKSKEEVTDFIMKTCAVYNSEYCFNRFGKQQIQLSGELDDHYKLPYYHRANELTRKEICNPFAWITSYEHDGHLMAEELYTNWSKWKTDPEFKNKLTESLFTNIVNYSISDCVAY